MACRIYPIDLLIERFGKKRMVNFYFILIIAIALSLILLKNIFAESVFMDAFIIAYRLVNAFAKIAVFAIAMQCCSKNISASQFTLFMTFGATGSIAGAALIGPIKEHFNWDISFLFFVLFILIACVVLNTINIDQQIQRINNMEKEKK